MPTDEARELLAHLVEAVNPWTKGWRYAFLGWLWAGDVDHLYTANRWARTYLARTAPEGREESKVECICRTSDLNDHQCPVHGTGEAAYEPHGPSEALASPAPPRSSAQGAREAITYALVHAACASPEGMARLREVVEALAAERVRERDRGWARAFGIDPDGSTLSACMVGPETLAEYLAERHRIDVEERVREALEKAAGMLADAGHGQAADWLRQRRQALAAAPAKREGGGTQ